MAIYTDLSQLGRVQLPGGTTKYELVDVDGRLMLAPEYSTTASYSVGDHIRYDGSPYGCNLYRAKVDIPAPAGAFDATKWDNVTVDSEIRRLEGIMAGGVHYRGKTTTVLYDGATTNPITINGASYTAESGDLVLLDLTSASVVVTYATNTAYAIHTYIKDGALYYITTDAITAIENTSIDAISSKIDQLKNEPEFLFDGTSWAVLGSISEGLGDLAYKDSASGPYTRPTGSGSVTIKNYTETTKYLVRTTITGTNGTDSATLVSGGSSKNQWKQDSTNPTVVYGTADVGTAVTYGTANPGTAVTGVAQVDSQKSFDTDGAKVVGVEGDCLVFDYATKGNIYGVKDATGVSITPAVASNTTLTPAKAADSTRTINNLVSDGTLTGSYTLTDKTLAKVASSATYVATGAVGDSADGNAVLTALTPGTESATVTVGTESATVTVK